MSGVPSDERSGLSFVTVIIRPLLVNIYRISCNAHVSDITDTHATMEGTVVFSVPFLPRNRPQRKNSSFHCWVRVRCQDNAYTPQAYRVHVIILSRHFTRGTGENHEEPESG
jgi:hypothetical protein